MTDQVEQPPQTSGTAEVQEESAPSPEPPVDAPDAARGSATAAEAAAPRSDQPTTGADSAQTTDDAAPPPEPAIDQPPLDDRLRTHLDNSEATSAGRAFYEPGDTEMFSAAQDVPPEPGWYTVDMHGDPDSTYIGTDAISADELGTMLENDPNYNGEPVRLFSCETGQGTDPYAQELADRLGVDVSAPTELAWSDTDGNTFVTGSDSVDQFGRPIPNLPPDGQWQVFHPRKGEH